MIDFSGAEQLIDGLWHFLESVDLLSFLIVTLIAYAVCGCACDGIMAIQKALFTCSDPSVREPLAIASACSWVFFIIIFLQLAGDFSGNTLYLLERAARSFLTACIGYGILGIACCILFVVAEWFRRMRGRVPSFTSNIVGGIGQLRYLIPRLPKRPTRPPPEPSPEEAMQMRLEEARHEFEVRSGSLTGTPLTQTELQAVRSQLRQEYLRTIRHILRGEAPNE